MKPRCQLYLTVFHVLAPRPSAHPPVLTAMSPRGIDRNRLHTGPRSLDVSPRALVSLLSRSTESPGAVAVKSCQIWVWSCERRPKYICSRFASFRIRQITLTGVSPLGAGDHEIGASRLAKRWRDSSLLISDWPIPTPCPRTCFLQLLLQRAGAILIVLPTWFRIVGSRLWRFHDASMIPV